MSVQIDVLAIQAVYTTGTVYTVHCISPRETKLLSSGLLSLYNMYTHMKMQRKHDPPTSPFYTTALLYLYANIVGARIL